GKLHPRCMRFAAESDLSQHQLTVILRGFAFSAFGAFVCARRLRKTPCRENREGGFDGKGGVAMSEIQAQIAELLHEAGETHHQVYRITDGEDADWASWYADWLIRLSELPKLLGTAPVRSELVYILVKLDKDFTRNAPGGRWEDYYAGALIAHFKG